jgi:hypothetical protein
VRDNRKQVSVCAPGQKRATRLDTLGGDYTEAAIRERLANPRVVGGSGGRKPIEAPGATRVNLLIDIQAKIREGKGAGYEQWAAVFNIKQAAKTLVFLKENGIDRYEDLVKKASAASGSFAALTKKIKDAEARMKEISELQKYIGQYGKTRDVYAQYKASGWNRDFYDAHAADIILHRAAKKYFDGLGVKKLPSIKSLKEEYAKLAGEKKRLYADYHATKDLSRQLTLAQANAAKILGVAPTPQKSKNERDARHGDTLKR